MEIVRPEPVKSSKRNIAIIISTLVTISLLYFAQLLVTKDTEEALNSVFEQQPSDDIKINRADLKGSQDLLLIETQYEKQSSDLKNKMKLLEESKNFTIEDLESDLREKDTQIRNMEIQLKRKDQEIAELKIGYNELAKTFSAFKKKSANSVEIENNETFASGVKITKKVSIKPTEKDIVENYKLLRSTPVSYPQRAESREKNGTAIVQFTIESSGYVSDLIILSEKPKGWGFGKAAARAANSLRFEPKKINGRAVRTEKVTKKYSFNVK